MSMIDAIVPKLVTITNNSPVVLLGDAGARTGPLAVPFGENAYTDPTLEIVLYQTNISKDLLFGDSVQFLAFSTNELVYYTKYADIPGVTVTVEDQDQELPSF